MAPVPLLADITPRLYSSGSAVKGVHGYASGVDFTNIYFDEVNRPLEFIGLPIATPGIVGRFDMTGNSGDSVVSVAVGSDGSLDETDGAVRVVAGGTVGTDTIRIAVSLDDGENERQVRLGTATSYTIPDVGLTLSFAAGDLVTGDTALKWHSTAPLTDGASITAAKDALAAGQRVSRAWLLVGDIREATDVDELSTAISVYETASERYGLAKASIADRLPLAKMSKIRNYMTGSPEVTFLEVGPPGDTATRDVGSFFSTDGFRDNDFVHISGTTSNDVDGAKITDATGAVITFGTHAVTNETTSDAVIFAAPGLEFVDGGVGDDTLVRSRGSWLDDGFRPDEPFKVTSSVSNDGTYTPSIVTATTLTVPTGSFTAEEISSWAVTIVGTLTATLAIAAADDEFAGVNNDRLELGWGRLRRLSPVTAARLRRPVEWAAVTREFGPLVDLSEAAWHKEDGQLQNWSLEDQEGIVVEHDERTVGGAIDARFTSARTWANGPTGAFVAKSLTRADANSPLSFTHNMYVANLMQTVVQRTSENFAGATLLLQSPDQSGARKATEASLAAFDSKVQGAIDRTILGAGGAPQRASQATWTASRDDDLGVVDAKLTGNGELNTLGTLVEIETTITVR
jgi:hypothetical protein